MARRKVNVKFLVIAGLLLGGIAVAGGGLWWWRHRHRMSPAQMLAHAEELTKAGDFDQAARYDLSAGQTLKDPKLMVSAGDMFYKLAYEDPNALRHALDAWHMAYTTDPTYLPALQRQLAYWHEWMQLQNANQASAAVYENMRDAAQKMLKLDPSNKEAKAAMPISVIDGAIHLVETDPDKIAEAVKQLRDLQSGDPTNPEIPFYIAAASELQAQKLARQGKSSEAMKLSADAEQVMADAVKAQDQNSIIHFRAAQIYAFQPIAPTTSSTDASDARMERVRAEVDKASALIKPGDPEYAEIRIFAATLAAGKDQTAAEKIYRDLLKENPSELAARIKLADMLSGRGHRDEAIDLLTNIPKPTAEQRSGPRGLFYSNLETEALSNVTNFRLDKFFGSHSKTEQEALLQQAETDFRLLEPKAPNNPYILRIKAKIQIAKGQTTDAIATLGSALTGLGDKDPMRYEVMFLLARAYLTANQFGSAKLQLQQIVSTYPQYDPARLLLTQTQMRENDLDGASANLAVLEKHLPNAVEVIRMRIGLLGMEKKPDQAKEVYRKLPETNRNQRMDKATIAILTQQPEEAKRLLDVILAADPGDVDAALAVADYYVTNAKDNAKALTVIETALKAKPDNVALLMEQAKIGGSSPAELTQIRQNQALKIADPLERELALFDAARHNSDSKGALDHLTAAEKINPRDVRVLNTFFEHNLATSNWDKAFYYADRLADINADQVHGLLFKWRVTIAQATSESDDQKRNAELGKAHDLATQLAHDFPDFAQSLICLGQTAQAMGNYEEALPNYASAKDKQPENPEAYRGLIECFYALKRPDDAKKVIDEGLVKLPTVNAFKELLLQHEMTYGDPQRVVAAREKMVKDAPDSVPALLSLAQVYARVAGVKASKPATEKESNAWYEKAKTVLAQGAEKFPDQLQFTISYGTICNLLQQVAPGEALWRATAARPQWKDNPAIPADFAEFYLRANRTADAEKVLQDFLATPAGKNNVDIILKLSMLLASDNKYDHALAVVDSLPDEPRLQFQKVDILLKENKFADAEKSIKALMEKNPSSLGLSTALAYVYLNSNRVKESTDLLNQVLAANPGLTSALYFRAQATLKTPGAKIQDAINDLLAVRENEPGNLKARYLLSDCHLRVGDQDKSIQDLEDILKSNPGEKAARIRLLETYSNIDPPKWLDAERIARDGEANADLAADADFLAAEGRMFAKRGNSDRAVACVKQALKAQPQNLAFINSYYGILIQGKMYDQLLSETDTLPAKTKDLSWVHSFRGTALCKTARRDDGIAEFISALKIAIAAKDEPAAEAAINDLVDAVDISTAIKVISKLPEASQTRWQVSIAWLQWKNHDVVAARKTVEGIMPNLSTLTPGAQKSVLGFASSLYMQTPDRDDAKARDLLLQLVKLTPDDYRIYNNLACNSAVSAADSLDYSQRAYDLMRESHNFEPLVADTYGWNLVQSGKRLDDGISVLLDAWKNKQFVDVAYHLGEAYIKKNNGNEADKYLKQAQAFFDEAVKSNNVPDMTLGGRIIDAQKRADALKGKTHSGGA